MTSTDAVAADIRMPSVFGCGGVYHAFRFGRRDSLAFGVLDLG